MKALSLPTALLATLLLAGWAAFGPITFERNSTITIEGTSNVHGWTCSVPSFTATGAGDASGAALTSLTALSVTVPVASIDCRNRTMNTKLREALGSTPVTFVLTRGTVGAVANGRFPIQSAGRLTVNGTARPVTFVAQGRSLGEGRFQVTGSVPVTMSQHGVRPPTALAGTMRTGDRVTVAFDVTIRAAR